MDTPLLPSRSLGALLGFADLWFKVESGQPTGSWLDRDAVRLVQDAHDAGVSGLCLVGSGPLGLALAVQCARAGLRLVLLRAADGEDCAHAAADEWLTAFGARRVVVQATEAMLVRAAPAIAARTGLTFVGPANPDAGGGFAAVVSEIEGAGGAASVLAVPSLTGSEPVILDTLAQRRSHAIPLPLDDPSANQGGAGGRPTRPYGVVGNLSGTLSPGAVSDAVVSVAVTTREADAARVLLAREEGIVASRVGAAGLAALIRAIREDRARRPREQRLPKRPGAVVVVTGDPLGIEGGPPRAGDAVPSRAVSLDEIVAEPGRWMVEPPAPR